MAEELQHGRWELPASSLDPSSSSFLGPQAAYIDGGVACIREAGGAAAEEGSSLVDIAEVGYFGLMQSSLNSGPIMVRKPASGLCMQQRLHDHQPLGEELRQLIPAAPLPQPRRQPSYSIPTSRQFSRSVPSSPTFATSRLQMSPAAMNTGGGGSAGVSRRGNVLPTVSRNLAAYSQQASSSASVLTSSLDLASCTSILVPPSPGSIKSASFSGDHKAAAATSSTFSSDHSARAAKFSTEQAAAVRTTGLASDQRARSANFGSDQSAAARAAGFTSEEAARSVNFSSELAAAASLFLPFLPCTPASSTTSMNPAAGEQDHQVQAASTSGAATSITGAKKRRLQPAGVRSKSSSKLGGEDGHVAAATQDTMSLGEALPLILSQGGADVDITPTGIEMSNNSANIEGEESTMKGNSTITSPSTCMKTQVCDGPSPPKQDYIHVRARRGQATDSHSLAERVRREKISERMKFLQDLVPGCNKITGKAVMLDEIINYVQSLQRQVEFLSMKLSAFNPQTSKFEASHIINHLEPKSIQIGTTQQFNQIENHYHGQHDLHLSVSLLQSDVQQQAAQLQQQSVNTGAHEAWEDELQSLVQMGFPTLP